MSTPPVAELLSLAGRRALVTGASGGIGAVCGARLAEAGAEVICLAHRRSGDAEALAARLRSQGRVAEATATDLSAPGAAEVLGARLGSVDLLLHAAARQDMRALAPSDEAAGEASFAHWQGMLAANLSASAALLAGSALCAGAFPACSGRFPPSVALVSDRAGGTFSVAACVFALGCV